MGADRSALLLRKGQLLERSARQRVALLELVGEAEALGAQWRQWRGPLRTGGMLLSAGALLLALLRPRRGLRWLSRAWLGWRGWLALQRRALAVLAALRTR